MEYVYIIESISSTIAVGSTRICYMIIKDCNLLFEGQQHILIHTY